MPIKKPKNLKNPHKKFILCGNRELWRVYAYKKTAHKKNWFLTVNCEFVLCIYQKIAHKKTGKTLGWKVNAIYLNVIRVSVFFRLSRKIFFCSETELMIKIVCMKINDENVNGKRFEMHGLVEFWKMEILEFDLNV